MVHNAETEQLRQQLLQAQRLSSMGALASSAAHEFNNILTTIINYAKMGLRAEGDDRARTEALEKILKGSQRARPLSAVCSVLHATSRIAVSRATWPSLWTKSWFSPRKT